eukprot:13387654-Alexandrium_andersonii.AAC.1
MCIRDRAWGRDAPGQTTCDGSPAPGGGPAWPTGALPRRTGVNPRPKEASPGRRPRMAHASVATTQWVKPHSKEASPQEPPRLAHRSADAM